VASEGPDRVRGDIAGSSRLVPAAGAWLVAAAALVVLLAVANAYGFHRDELYFILAGRHPDWGYVDQPPLTPLLSAFAAGVLGVSPFAVRIAPAIADAAVVLLAADICRRLGGSRTSQVLAAIILGISGWLGAGHLDVTVTFDVFFWTLALWLLVPLLAAAPEQHERARWLALGLVIGIALQNKTLAIALPATVAAGLVLARRWDVFRRPWPWIAAIIVVAIWLPNLVWQAENGWPQIQMAQSISADQGSGLDGRLKAIVQILAIAGPLLWPVAIAGTAWLLRGPASRPWRALGIGFLLDLALMLVANGKSYYVAGYLPPAIAAGAIPLTGWLSRGRTAARWGVFAGAAVVSGAIVAVVFLPLVPAASLGSTPIPDVYGESAAQVGWPQLASQVESVVATLSPSDRARAVILTGSYGQYSALTLLGSGLPQVVSGHNSTWAWGQPASDARPVILIGFSSPYADARFTGCRQAATIDNGLGVPTQEQGTPIWICDAPRKSWDALWPSLRHIN
jgi:hypothetical protein